MFKDYSSAYLPRGAGDRIRRLKQTAVAQRPAGSVEGGIRSLPVSTRLIGWQGLQDQVVYHHNGVAFTKSGCCTEEA
jgi:hypothetical protein